VPSDQTADRCADLAILTLGSKGTAKGHQLDQALAGGDSRARHEVSQRLVDRAEAEVDGGRLFDEILDVLADPNIADEQAGGVSPLRVGRQRLIAARRPRLAGPLRCGRQPAPGVIARQPITSTAWSRM
jgi:hypothetical protein